MLLAAAQAFSSYVQTIATICTVSISAIVVTYTAAQWRLNKDKLRLDLYEKRFAIYNRIYDAYEVLLSWNDTPEQEQIVKDFFRAFREARFMFPDKAGVYGYLEQFADHARYIVHFKTLREGYMGLPEELAKAAAERMEHVSWILGSMQEVEDLMAPYLSFHSL